MWCSVAVVGTPFAGHVRWLDVSSVRHDPPPHHSTYTQHYYCCCCLDLPALLTDVLVVPAASLLYCTPIVLARLDSTTRVYSGIHTTYGTLEQNVPMMCVLAKVTAKTASDVPRVRNVIATVANMCCGMVHRRAYK